MKKASAVFNKIRFAKLDPNHDKAGPFSTDDEEHGAVSEIEWNQQLKHQKHRAMQEQEDISSEHGPGKKYKKDVTNVDEQHADEGKFVPVKPKMIQNTPVVSPRPTNDSANVKLKEEDMSEQNGENQKHPFVAVHAKKGTHDTHGSTSYEAAQNAAKHWKMKSTAGISVYRSDKTHVATEETQVEESRGHKIIDTFFKNRQAAKNQQTDHDKWKAEYKKARDAGSSSANAKARANGAVYEEQQIEEGEITRTKTGLVHKGTYGTSYSGKGSEAATQKDAKDLTTLNNKRTRNLEKGMDVHFGKSVDEGYYKDIDTNRKEDERLGSWKKETPWKKISGSGTVTDKSGAKHTPMSRARDLARAAMKKNIKEFVVTESRLADIVREAQESAKKKKKEAKEKDKDVSDDKFQKDPELSTQIIRND